MITHSHMVIYSRDPEADRAFFRDVLGFGAVDAGDGWLIFALPPAEAAFHPADSNDRHELFFVCDDLEATVADLVRHGIACSDPVEESWGFRTALPLPGGGKLGMYEPKHILAAGES
jgi:catechol 2,3-dioxygenase-like lactoylglutathione lyase family enzyme